MNDNSRYYYKVVWEYAGIIYSGIFHLGILYPDNELHTPAVLSLTLISKYMLQNGYKKRS